MDDFSISPLLWWIGLSLQGWACSIYKHGLDHAVDCLWMPGQVMMFKLVLEKAEEPEIKLPASTGSLKNQESSRKTSILLY